MLQAGFLVIFFFTFDFDVYDGGRYNKHGLHHSPCGRRYGPCILQYFRSDDNNDGRQEEQGYAFCTLIKTVIRISDLFEYIHWL